MFETLDQATAESFPPEHTRIVAILEHGDAAIALFDTRPGGRPYLYEVHYRRVRGRWSETGSGNGPGWHRLDADRELGVETLWAEAPPGADAVRGELGGQVLEAGVVGGVYLMAWWDVPPSSARVTAFRVRGEWVGVP